MKVVYAREPIQEDIRGISKPVFLVGPSPRSIDVQSWRPNAIDIFKQHEFDGVLYVPEPREKEGDDTFDYHKQVYWEYRALAHCREFGAILAWVPRELKTMPAFTTNVEFGLHVGSENFFYGRPDNAPKTRYLDFLYKKERRRLPETSIERLIEQVILHTRP